MKIRLGTLRRILREEAWVPGAPIPGGSDEIEETDDRMVGDDKGPGIPDPEADDMSDHLKDDRHGRSLGSPAVESVGMPSWFKDDLRSFFLQEEVEAPAGFYPSFDMTKDHTGTDDLSATWYRSPGREPGGDGDPSRVSDPYAYLGFHPPQGDKDPTATPPSVSGEEGTAARLAPPIWQLSAGSDTSKVLGANAKPASTEVGSEDESEEGEEGLPGEGEPGAEGDEGEGQKQG